MDAFGQNKRPKKAETKNWQQNVVALCHFITNNCTTSLEF